jgi:hypothetical protein
MHIISARSEEFSIQSIIFDQNDDEVMKVQGQTENSF